MVKKKILVFISEPSWIENPIPSWLNNNDYFVVTESDSVINECYLKKIDVFALGEYIEPSKNIYFIDKSIEIERTEINNLTNKLDKNSYQAESYHGISNKIYYLNYYHETIENLFKKCSFDKAIFVVGERFLASNEETPKGSYLQYYLFNDACSRYCIKFSRKYNEINSYQKINSTKKRYDFYFHNNSQENRNIVEIKKSTYNKNSTKPSVLFIYQYEACKDDLEPLLDEAVIFSNVLKMSITPYAPKIYDYDFNFSNFNYENKYKSFDYNYDFIFNLFKLHLNFINEKILNIIARKYYKYYYSINFKLMETINIIDNIVKSHNINKIVITAFPGSTTSVLAKYFTSINIKVILRQHGELSAPQWPLKCFVNDVEFSTISKFYESALKTITNNISITSRYYPRQIKDQSKEKNKIIITNDLFFNPQNKIIFINFFNLFLNNLNKKYQITLRSHPRYFGELLPDLNSNGINFENAQEVDLIETISNCSVFIMPADTLSSVFCDSIRNEIPSVIISPIGLKSTSEFEPYCFEYPFIINNVKSLIDFIYEIENNIDFKNDVILQQKKWLKEILGLDMNKINHITPACNLYSKRNDTISILDYYKFYLKNLFKKFQF